MCVFEMYQNRGSVIVSKEVHSKPNESIRSHSCLNHSHTYILCEFFRRFVSKVSTERSIGPIKCRIIDLVVKEQSIIKINPNRIKCGKMSRSVQVLIVSNHIQVMMV